MTREGTSPRVTLARAREITGFAAPPKRVTQRQHDGFDEELRSLAAKPQGQIDLPEIGIYLDDLAYSVLQRDLFDYLFPPCLMAWQRTLLMNRAFACGDAEFHASLLSGNVLDRMLSSEQRLKVWSFFTDGLLDALDRLDQSAYPPALPSEIGWLHRLNSLGLVMPSIAGVWRAWWSVPGRGPAIAVLQYCSGLIYTDGANPLFVAWTPSAGGGGPILWENDSNAWNVGWRPENVAFLQTALDLEVVEAGMARATAALRGHPVEPTAVSMLSHFALNREPIAMRLRQIPGILAMPDLPLSWPAAAR